MPRAARVILPDFPHHIVQRGHNRQPTFHQPADYELYLGLLEQFAPASGCAVHAYVLMTNHVHLLVTPRARDSLAALMSPINQRFVQSVNRHRVRCGSSWQGRFRSCVVDTNSYFMTCQRYIELNPVRAGMVHGPEGYRWSSYAANAFGAPSTVVMPHECYLALGEDPAARRELYRGILGTPLRQDELDAIRSAAAGNRPLGDDAFLERLQRKFGLRVRRQRPGPKPGPDASSGSLF